MTNMAFRLCLKTRLLVSLIQCFVVLISAAPPLPGVPTPPAGDPFAPPPMPTYPSGQQTFYNSPPNNIAPNPNYPQFTHNNFAQPVQNNYPQPPPNYPQPLPNYPPPPQMNYAPPPQNNQAPPLSNQNFGFGAFNPSQLQYPQNTPMNNMVSFPPGNTMGNDINKPMPPDAAAAIDSANTFASSSNSEQEYESDPGASGGGMGSTQTYNPPPAYPVHSQSAYGRPSSTSLLDAYYGRGQGRQLAYQQQPQNNGLFGGLFGNTPGGNLMGALVFNEILF